jgi:8-oxo-dGTP pyrophosphatase MutT (NUDIX family)
MEDDDYSDLHGDHRDLMPAGTLRLEDLAGPGAELSTGLVLTWRRQLVFAFDPRAKALGSQGCEHALAFVGVGGHLDPGEGWEQAVAREAMEEANCPISIGDSPVTYLCRQGSAPTPITYRWAERERPLLVWIATFELRRGPDRALTPVTIVNAVFRAAALGRPSPGSEVKGLLLLDQETLVHTFAAPRTLADLQARGAQVIGEAPSPDVLLAPGGSAYFLAQWLAWQDST